MKINIIAILIIIFLFVIVFGYIMFQDRVKIDDYISDEQPLIDGTLMFDYAPFDMDKVAFIEPMGSMIGGHVTPIDHQYYLALDHLLMEEAEIVVDVISPANGTISSIQHMSSLPGEDGIEIDDYRFIIQHNSKISSVYIHVDNLSEKIAKVAPPRGKYANTNINVKAGEIIGNYSGSVDYNVVDENIVLTGFVNPDSYEAESWKIHTPDPFDYFNEPIRSQLIEKCLRTEEPIGGKIDHDIDGKLVGNWFQEGTNGYGGLGQENYWEGHLAIAYHSVDPEHIIISLGSYNGEAEQFGVKNNAPDPANVIVETGLVEYELVDYDFFNGDERWDRMSLVKGLKLRNNDDYVQGVVLFQLIEYRKLKVEIFPNEIADTVDGFTENALIYVR